MKRLLCIVFLCGLLGFCGCAGGYEWPKNHYTDNMQMPEVEQVLDCIENQADDTLFVRVIFKSTDDIQQYIDSLFQEGFMQDSMVQTDERMLWSGHHNDKNIVVTISADFSKTVYSDNVVCGYIVNLEFSK